MLKSLLCGYKVETSKEGSPYNSSLATDEIVLMVDLVRVTRNMIPPLISESESTKEANTRKYEQRGAYRQKKSKRYRRKDRLRTKNLQRAKQKFDEFQYTSESASYFQPLRMNLHERVMKVSEKFYDMGYDEMASRLEDIILFVVALRKSSDFVQAATIIAMKIKDMCKSNKSLIQTVYKYLFGGTSIDSIVKFLKVDCNPGDYLEGVTPFSRDTSEEALVDDPVLESEAGFGDFTEPSKKEANSFDRFITAFAKATEGYGRIMASPLMAKMTTLMSTLLALGLLGEEKSCSITIKGLEIFNFYARKGRTTATDLVEVVLDTIKFLLERGHACFTQGTFTPLFTSVERLAQYDLDYAQVVSGYEYVKADNFKGSVFMDAAHFELELRGLLDYSTRLVKALSKGERAPYAKKLLDLQRIKADFDTRKVQGGLRKAPFSFFIHGGSGVGKSTVVNTLIAHSLQEIAITKGNTDFIVKESAICTLNEMDKYHSDYGSHILAVLLDDFANGKPEYAAKNPTVDVINFINNIHRTAIQAEAELKGKIPLVPCVVGATSNVKKKFAFTYSEEPLSILRRFQVHLTMKVKKAFRKKGCAQLDPEKMRPYKERGVLCPDAWSFTAYEWVEGEDTPFIKTTGSREPVERVLYFEDEGKMKPAKNINFGQVMDLFSQVIPEHEKAQTCCVDSAKAILSRPRCPHGKNRDWCKICSLPAGKCTPCTDAEEIVEPDPDIVSDEEIEESEVIEDTLPIYESDYLPVPSDLEAPPDDGEEADIGATVEEMISESAVTDAVTKVSKTLQEYRDSMNCVDTYKEICNEYESLLCVTPIKIYSRLPSHIRNNPIVQALILSNVDQTFAQTYKFWIIFFLCCLYMPLFGMAPMSSLNYFVGLTIPLIYLQIDSRREALEELVMSSEAIHASTVQSIKEGQAKLGRQLFVGAGLTVAAVTLAYQVYRAFKPNLSSEAYNYVTDVCQWKVTPERENVYKTPEITPLPTGVNHSNSYENIYQVFKKNLVSVRFWGKQGQYTHSNGFWLCTNVLVIPAHEVPTEKIRIDIIMRDINNLNGVNLMNLKLTPECCQKVHEYSDLALAYIGNSGDKKNLLGFFPETISEKEIVAKMITRKSDDFQLKERVCSFTKFNPVKTSKAFFKYAAHYQWSEPSFGGLCGSPLVRDTRTSSYIAGVHLAGSQKKGGYNACEMVTRGMLQDAIDRMEKDPDKVFAVSEGSMKVEEYGINYDPLPIVPKNSPLNFIENKEDSPKQIAIYGHVPKFVTRAKSRVVESPLSQYVAKRCGKPNIYGPPANCRRITLPNGESRREIPEYQPDQIFLNDAGGARQEFESKVLARAMSDIFKKYDDAISNSSTLQKELHDIRPLTEVETVSGIDGEKFVDQMKVQTSTGFPLNTPKEKYIVYLHPEEHDQAVPKTLKREILDSALEDVKAYLKGERAYCVFQSCKKDEVTKLSKTKVRNFQAAPLKTQYLMRKYFLKIAKFMSDNPLLSECAVGINAQGPQWHELDKYISKFGRKKRTVAGDYKKYDTSMSPRMVMLAFKLMIRLAEKSGNYSEDDIKIMKGLMTDVAYPIIMAGGCLLQLFGTNPTGQGLTVYINCIVNKIYLRCVFFTIYPNYTGMFHHVVALMTYGDDCKFSVHSDFDEFNHTNIQRVFAINGIVYTMADKTSDSIPFMDHDEADFLKRHSWWSNRYSWKGSTGMWMAKLDEDSIFKSLHANMESAENSRTEVAMQCIDGAMREFWFHGREVFEQRHEQLKLVLEDANLTDAAPKSFFENFDSREREWMDKYDIKYATEMESESGCVNVVPEGAVWCETEELIRERAYLNSPELCAVDTSPYPCMPEYEFPQPERHQMYDIQFPIERKLIPFLYGLGLIVVLILAIGPWAVFINVDLLLYKVPRRRSFGVLLLWFLIVNFGLIENSLKQLFWLVYVSDIVGNTERIADLLLVPVAISLLDFYSLVKREGIVRAINLRKH